jgi:transposase
MSRYWISVLVWLLSFFLPFAVMELLAVLWKGCPWATLSTTTMTSQARYPWLTIPITAGLSILFFHIVRFSNLTAGVLDPKKKLEYSRAKVLYHAQQAQKHDRKADEALVSARASIRKLS